MFGGRKAARRFSLLLLEVSPVLVERQAARPLGAETYTLGFSSSLGASASTVAEQAQHQLKEWALHRGACGSCNTWKPFVQPACFYH